MSDYHVNIFYSEEDMGYIADVPDLENGSAFGETREIALREVEKAKLSWLKTACESGVPIPAPRYRPAIYQMSGI